MSRARPSASRWRAWPRRRRCWPNEERERTSQAEADPSIHVDRLRVVRGGRTVIPELTCDVQAGSVTGLLGPSGSGKTTLLRAIVGVQRVAGGAIDVLGLPAGAKELRTRIGYMTQGVSVYEDLSVRENLRFFAALLGAGGAAVDGAIALVALEPERDRLVSYLSGGQRARVSLAAALIGSPAVLVLDEPTVGLDPVLRRDLWRLFHELASAGAALLVATHVMDEAEHCDRLLLLRDGAILATGSPAELRERTGARDLDTAFLRLVEGRHS